MSERMERKSVEQGVKVHSSSSRDSGLEGDGVHSHSRRRHLQDPDEN